MTFIGTVVEHPVLTVVLVVVLFGGIKSMILAMRGVDDDKP